MVAPEHAQPDYAPDLALTATDLALDGPWGPVFGPVNLEIRAGGVTILEGSAVFRTYVLTSDTQRTNESQFRLTVRLRSNASPAISSRSPGSPGSRTSTSLPNPSPSAI